MNGLRYCTGTMDIAQGICRSVLLATVLSTV